jgi:hypothetical protein
VSFRIHIYTIPGLAETGDDHPSPRKPYNEAIDDFLATPGIAGTGIEDEFDDVLRDEADETDEGVPGWEGLRRFVTGKRHAVIGEDKRPVELGAYWLTLPDVPDAEVEFSISDAKSTETSASLTVAGIGGGPQFTVELREGLKHKAKCSEKGVISTIATFQQISVTNRQGTVIGTYPRLVALDKNRVNWSFVPAAPPLAADLGPEGPSRGYDQSGTDGSTTVSLSIERDITWNMSAGISLPKLGGISVNVSAKVTYRKAVKFEYQLPGRHRYEATRYKAFPAYIWSVQP